MMNVAQPKLNTTLRFKSIKRRYF